MRGAVFERYGPPENFEIRDLDPPALRGPYDVRVAIHASSINPIDWKIRAGLQRGAIHYRLPRVTGLDLSGVVTEVGAKVSRFQLGDEVFSSPSHQGPGCYAEETVVRESELAPKPKNLTHVEAATLPLVGLTAWGCLMPRVSERPGQKVFIMAGSGGVGTFAIQLAKHHGAHVSTTCSERNHALVRELGADVCIDYRTTAFQDVLSDQDIVLDALGYEATEHGLSVLAKGGLLSSIVSGLPGNTEKYGPHLGLVATGLGMLQLRVKGALQGVTATTVVRRADGERLRAIAELAEQGVIRPVVDRVFPLEQIAEAHAYGETGRIRGKVAIDMGRDG